jgi:multidrug transporter EmrE-like cation transporter
MQAAKIVGILLIIAGTLGLVYGGFSYTEESTAAKIGSLEITLDQEKDVNVPMWAGVGAIVAGALLLLAGGRRG